MSLGRSRWRRVCACLMVAACGVLARAAAAQTTVVIPRTVLVRDLAFGALDSGVVAGGNFVAAGKAGRGRVVLDWVSLSGSVRQVPLPGASTRFLPVLYGSATRLVVEEFVDGLPGARFLAGPPLGPLAVVEPCLSTTAQSTVLAGDVLAYSGTPCAGGGLSVVVRDLSTPGPPTTIVLPQGSQPTRLRVAGDYVAYRLDTNSGARLIERNWHTGQLLFDQPPPVPRDCFSPSGFVINGPPQQAFCDFQIDQDGSFWEMTDTQEFQDDPNGKYSNPIPGGFCSGTISRFPPGATSSQPVINNACELNSLDVFGVARGTVLFRQSVGPAVAAPGVAPRPVGPINKVYAFDGQTLTASYQTCTARLVVTNNLTSDPPVPDDTRLCPLQPVRAIVHLGRHPYLTLRFRCPSGCVGPLVVGTLTSNGDGVPDASSPNFTVAPNTSRLIRIRLPAHGAIATAATRRGRARSRRRRQVIPVGLYQLALRDDPRTPFQDLIDTIPLIQISASIRSPH